MTPNPEMRASDADRDRVAEALREHCAEGRIDLDELNERLEATYQARTLGELQEITADLPEHDLYQLPIPAAKRSSSAPRTPVPRSHGELHLRGTAGMWATYATANLICFTVWLVALVGGAGLQGLWWLWVAGPWGAVLLARTVFGGPDKDSHS